MYAAVRVRGQPDVNKKARRTLDNLRLKRKNQAILVPERDEFRGMLKTCKDFVTFGKIDEGTAEKLAESEGKNIDEENTVILNLNPPKKGYKDSRTHYSQGGSLGDRGEEIEGLLKKMTKVI